MNEEAKEPARALRRRDVLELAAAGAVGALLGRRAQAAETGPAPAAPRAQVAMLVYDDMVLLDLAGPQTVLSLAMAQVHLVAPALTAVRTDLGVPVMPTTTFADCPADLDVLFVPGGLRGSIAAMQDAATLEFLAQRGANARYVTSVCTGSLVLGAAGLLRGYRATSHWYVRELLPLMGATLEVKRVVEDRNRLTGGGVTAGIDFGLTLVARLRGADYAKNVQLVIEYDPEPPFDAGSPERADPALVADVRGRRQPLIDRARAAAQDAARRLGV